MHPSPSRIGLVAATLVLFLGVLPNSAAAQPIDLPADLPNAPVASTGYASSLEEEAVLLAKQRATPSFETIDKDWSGEQRGRAVPPSTVSAKGRFTKSSLESIKVRLAGTPLNKGDGFGYYYDAERDVIVASGNIDPNRLPKDAISAGQIEYTKAPTAGRLSRYSDSTPHWHSQVERCC